MDKYELTTLWQNTLGLKNQTNGYQEQVDFLRQAYYSLRQKAQLFASEINRSLPSFTIHDISHADALWGIASMILSSNENLNPAEGFVLGAAFLIHDLGMGIVAYQEGIEELKKTALWQDTYKALERKTLGSLEKKDLERWALESTLRDLHAQKAETLPLASWKDNLGNQMFLLEDSDLRNSYGDIIGKIAASHGTTIDRMMHLLGTDLIGAPGFLPSHWTIDPIKLGCLMRAVDAIDVDDSRAPSLLFTLRKPSGISKEHWTFQNKLNQPTVKGSRILFTSKSPFGIEESDSWWLCFDTLRMIDSELKSVDSFLSDLGRTTFGVNGVAYIDTPSRLTESVKVVGWKPVDTTINVSNVPKLVATLGGKELYGKNYKVPLRELIQNASDAIRARRILDDDDSFDGKIRVKFGEDANGTYIEISDNGVGMSSLVMTQSLLDFGQSFWGTNLMHKEFPLLEAKGYSSTEKYGIGFFSVFMLGSKVQVISRKYLLGREQTHVLDFMHGLDSRPILRCANPDEYIKDGGTIVRVWIEKGIKKSLLYDRFLEKQIPLSEILERLCPSLDCNLYVESETTPVISRNDWITMDSKELLLRIHGKSRCAVANDQQSKLLELLAKNMRTVTDSKGHIVARASLYLDKDYHFHGHLDLCDGMITIGGLNAGVIRGIVGIVKGYSINASRNYGMPIVSYSEISKWATEQSQVLADSWLDGNIQMHCATIVQQLGGCTGDLKCFEYRGGYISCNELVSYIKNENIDECILLSDAAVSVEFRRRNDNRVFIANPNVFWGEAGIVSILCNVLDFEYSLRWPNRERALEASMSNLFIAKLAEAWDTDVDTVKANAKISTDDVKYNAVIGTFGDQDANYDFADIFKRPN